MRIWYRGITYLFLMPLVDAPARLLPIRQSVAAKLPLEIIATIMAHLTYDPRSLKACTLTCFSWYIASAPHLHHTLPIRLGPLTLRFEFEWSVPFENYSKLGLLPFVKRLWVRRSTCPYLPVTPKQFNRILHQISTLTNIQHLSIDYLDIPSFMPKIRHYFGHFIPLVRSLGLGAPKGSTREILYFIGLFEHLEDLTLVRRAADYWRDELVGDLALVPPSTPPLRGRLVMSGFKRLGFLKDMIRLFGGIRFRYMDLYDVGETGLLLKACAKTLETVRLYPSDPCGE